MRQLSRKALEDIGEWVVPLQVPVTSSTVML